MNWLRSFRGRVLLGTFFWTLGLIPLLHYLFLVVHHQTRLIPHRYLGTFFGSGFLFILVGIWQFRAALLPFGRLRRQLVNLREGS
ncbi:MAG: hypothetical protein ACM3SW_07095, partial [Actinomycetota bacterium]